MRFIGVHGYKSNPTLNFWPWLSSALKDMGHDVIIPELPNSDEPDAIEWVQTLVDAVGPLSDEDIIIGHSLGAPTALKFLEAAEARSTPKGVLLIAPAWHIKSERFNGFFLNELDFEVLMWRAKLFTVLHSKDDTVIPIDHGKKYASELHAHFREVTDAGHFDGKSYRVILEELKRLVETDVPYEPGLSLENQYQGIH